MVKKPFDKRVRLIDSSDFSTVFADAPIRVSSADLLILAKQTGYDRPRLGIVVAKKHVKLANQRNRLKRVIRESFRHQQHDLPNVDIIVLVRKSAMGKDNKTLSRTLHKLWVKLTKKARAAVEPPT